MSGFLLISFVARFLGGVRYIGVLRSFTVYKIWMSCLMLWFSFPNVLTGFGGGILAELLLVSE